MTSDRAEQAARERRHARNDLEDRRHAQELRRKDRSVPIQMRIATARRRSRP